MKKTLKWFLSIVSVLTILTSSSSIAFAQDIDLKSVLTSIQEANKTVESQEGIGNLSFSLYNGQEELFGGDLDTDFRFNVDPRFSMEGTFSGNVRDSSQSVDENGNPVSDQAQETPFDLKVSMVEGIIYVFDGTSWSVEDFTQQEEELSKAFTEALNQAAGAQTEVNDDLVSICEKYFDISDNGTDYVFAMKPDIEAEAFWQDISKIVDIEKIKQEAVDEAIKQMQEQGTEVTEEGKAQMEETYNQAFDMVFDFLDKYEIHYNKETLNPSKIYLELSLNPEDIEKITGTADEETQKITGNLTFTMNFSKHGEQFDIQIPEGAPTFDEAASSQAGSETEASSSETSGEEATSEGSESSEVESGDDQAAESDQASSEATESESAE